MACAVWAFWWKGCYIYIYFLDRPAPSNLNGSRSIQIPCMQTTVQLQFSATHIMVLGAAVSLTRAISYAISYHRGTRQPEQNEPFLCATTEFSLNYSKFMLTHASASFHISRTCYEQSGMKAMLIDWFGPLGIVLGTDSTTAVTAVAYNEDIGVTFR